MTSVVFLGPTLSASEARVHAPGLSVRPPAACGDVYRAARDGARVIGIVDGYFDHKLSVWHKEVLWALSQGVQVYGAASMGALRAAELAAFGMIGVGRIFEDYLSGALEADDEVAVAHGPEERGYVAISEALVNVRATLQLAVREEVIDGPVAERLLSAGRAIFYPQRTYAAIIGRALEAGLPAAAATRFHAWLGPRDERRVDQKRADALLLIEQLQSPAASRAANFHFEYTEVWHEFLRQMNEAPAATRAQPPSGALLRAPRVDVERSGRRARQSEGRHEQASAQAWCVALERALALELMSQGDTDVDEGAVQAAADAFRRRHGLLTPEATQKWMDARGFDLETFSARMRQHAGVARFGEQARALARTELDWLLDEHGELPSEIG